MARYVAENEIPAGVKGHSFVGWDEINGRSTEATDPKNLNILMGRAFKAEFRSMKAGERRTYPNGRALFRQF